MQAVSLNFLEGRNFHFGVREHAMGAALNGMVVFGGVIPYSGTFLVFADYMRPSVRLAALSHIPSIFIFTHDSVGLGEEPTTGSAGRGARPHRAVSRHCPAVQLPVRRLPQHG